MQRKLIFICAALLLGLAQLSAANAPRKNAMGFYEYDTYVFTAKKGAWDKARNWQGGKLPEGIVRADIKGGSTVTISTPIATLGSFNLGCWESAKTQVVIEDGAKIDAYSVNAPVGNVNDADASIIMKGGEFSIGKEAGFNGTLDIGYNATLSGRASFRISGGKLTGGIKVGTNTLNTNEGTFTVVGSAPQITTHTQENNFFMLFASGTLEFVLDEKGVCSLDYRRGRVWLYDGSTLRIDGSAYRGPTKTIPLIQSERLYKENVRVEMKGFHAPYTATVSFTDTRAVLKISK